MPSLQSSLNQWSFFGENPIEFVASDRPTHACRYTEISDGKAMLCQLKRKRAYSRSGFLRSSDSQGSMAARIKRFSRDPVEIAAQVLDLPASEVTTSYAVTRTFSVGAEPRFR